MLEDTSIDFPELFPMIAYFPLVSERVDYE
jgi:hypothetical protein